MKIKQYENRAIDLGFMVPTNQANTDQVATRLTEKLNEYGLYGWTLVSVITIGPHAANAIAFLTREIKTP